MKLRVLEGEHFTCHSCTNCCRDWHVELLPNEIERVSGLRWSKDDPLHAARVLFRHAGKTFIAHRADAYQPRGRPSAPFIFIACSLHLSTIDTRAGPRADPSGRHGVSRQRPHHVRRLCGQLTGRVRVGEEHGARAAGSGAGRVPQRPSGKPR